MVKAGERNELGLKHQENGRGHTGFRQHPPQQLAFLVIQRVQMNDSGCAGPAVVDLILFCLAASFPLCACWLLYVCLVALSVNQQIWWCPDCSPSWAPDTQPLPPRFAVWLWLLVSERGGGSLAGLSGHVSFLICRLLPAPAVLLPSAPLGWICSCFGDVCQHSAALHRFTGCAFYQLLSGFLQSVFGLLFNCVVASAAQFYDASLGLFLEGFQRWSAVKGKQQRDSKAHCKVPLGIFSTSHRQRAELGRAAGPGTGRGASYHLWTHGDLLLHFNEIKRIPR